MENLDNIFYFLNKVFPDKSVPLTILDIGSRDCLEAIEFSKHFINSKVYSFEPNPDAIKIARKNSKEYKNHTLIEKAVSDKNGYIKFYPINPELTETTHKDGNIGASSMFKASGKYPIEKYVQKEIEVESITIEQFCKDNNINKIDFVWMDLQGAEYLAFKDQRKTDALFDAVTIYKPEPDQHLDHDFRPPTKLPTTIWKISPAIRSQIGGPDGFYFGNLKLQFASETLLNKKTNILGI